jgi:hypothetical protein
MKAFERLEKGLRIKGVWLPVVEEKINEARQQLRAEVARMENTRDNKKEEINDYNEGHLQGYLAACDDFLERL